MASLEMISRQPRIDSVMWLFAVTLMRIYNEKEQAEGKKMYTRRRKEAPGSETELTGREIELTLVLKEI